MLERTICKNYKTLMCDRKSEIHWLKEIIEETERQRDRETERQRDRQRERERERERERDN